MSRQRTKFHPSPCHPRSGLVSDLLVFESDSEKEWISLISCPADFPIELVGLPWILHALPTLTLVLFLQFELAVSQLIHHPEYNSTLILRSETVSESTADFPSCLPSLRGFRCFRNIQRKLLPRRPGRDTALEQHCTLYSTSSEHDPDSPPSVLVLTPILGDGVQLPYYHPTVYHLALRYIIAETPLLQIEVVPYPSTPTDLNSRLYRTCLALLDALHRYGWGALTSYKKRVMHDCLISREEYQDLYLIMRERHKHLVDQWQEVTDPLKHVFEVISLCIYFIALSQFKSGYWYCYLSYAVVETHLCS